MLNKKSSSVVIAGASGHLGISLACRLVAQGIRVVALGRDEGRLAQLLPDCECASYQQGLEAFRGSDAVINLAFINNSSDASWEEFESINVSLALRLAQQAATFGIPHFVQLSSTHALDVSDESKYAISRRLANQALADVQGINITTLYLPAVWGDRWRGKLSFLNRLPRWLALLLFRPLSALKPTAHMNTVLNAMLEAVAAAVEGNDRRVVADDMDRNIWYRLSCALRDYGFALSVLLLFWWVLLIIWLWVRLDSPGPGVFAQERVGKDGKPFTCYKFRTMRAGTRQAGTHEVSADAVTPVGAFLRRTKVDELPQVWNILKGEVRLVGPRPGLPVQRELFTARQARGVFSVKPGITGWAQIHDVDMSEPERLAWWDAQYIGMRGILLDLRIILATAFGRGRGDRVAK